MDVRTRICRSCYRLVKIFPLDHIETITLKNFHQAGRMYVFELLRYKSLCKRLCINEGLDGGVLVFTNQ